MNFLTFLLQVGDLFQGKFNWRGVMILFLFFLMGFIIVALGVFITYKAFFTKSKSKRDEF